MSWLLLVFILFSTRCARSNSQALFLTLKTPSSLTLLMVIITLFCCELIESSKARSSASKASSFFCGRRCRQPKGGKRKNGGEESAATYQVGLVGDDQEGLVDEERLDVVVEADLLGDRVSAGLRNVDEEEDAGVQVGQRGNGLHFDRVLLLERMVQDSWRIDDLPAEVVVIGVPNEERFGGEGVRLNFDVRSGDLVNEARLSDVGKSRDEERSRVRVDRRQARQVLANLLQVAQRRVELLHQRAHSAEEEEERVSSREGEESKAKA